MQEVNGSDLYTQDTCNLTQQEVNERDLFIQQATQFPGDRGDVLFALTAVNIVDKPTPTVHLDPLIVSLFSTFPVDFYASYLMYGYRSGDHKTFTRRVNVVPKDQLMPFLKEIMKLDEENTSYWRRCICELLLCMDDYKGMDQISVYKVLQGAQYKKVVRLDDFPGFAVTLEEIIVECRKDFMTISYMDTILLYSNQRDPVFVTTVGNHDIYSERGIVVGNIVKLRSLDTMRKRYTGKCLPVPAFEKTGKILSSTTDVVDESVRTVIMSWFTPDLDYKFPTLKAFGCRACTSSANKKCVQSTTNPRSCVACEESGIVCRAYGSKRCSGCTTKGYMACSTVIGKGCKGCNKTPRTCECNRVNYYKGDCMKKFMGRVMDAKTYVPGREDITDIGSLVFADNGGRDETVDDDNITSAEVSAILYPSPGNDFDNVNIDVVDRGSVHSLSHPIKEGVVDSPERYTPKMTPKKVPRVRRKSRGVYDVTGVHNVSPIHVPVDAPAPAPVPTPVLMPVPPKKAPPPKKKKKLAPKKKDTEKDPLPVATAGLLPTVVAPVAVSPDPNHKSNPIMTKARSAFKRVRLTLGTKDERIATTFAVDNIIARLLLDISTDLRGDIANVMAKLNNAEGTEVKEYTGEVKLLPLDMTILHAFLVKVGWTRFVIRKGVLIYTLYNGEEAFTLEGVVRRAMGMVKFD